MYMRVKNIIFVIGLFCLLISQAQTQSLDSFNFVIVPEQYSILGEKNQYQLNAMTKFYLEKQGFQVYYPMDAPNASKCSSLYADLERIKGFMGTKLQLVLKDCNNNEVYRSEEGSSKLKDYEKAYQDAFRKAVQNLPKVQIKSSISEQQFAQESVVSTNGTVPTSSQSYTKDGKDFLLRPTSEGFSFYEEMAMGDLRLIGKIIFFENNIKFLDPMGNTANVYFDKRGDLSLEFSDKIEQYTLVRD